MSGEAVAASSCLAPWEKDILCFPPPLIFFWENNVSLYTWSMHSGSCHLTTLALLCFVPEEEEEEGVTGSKAKWFAAAPPPPKAPPPLLRRARPPRRPVKRSRLNRASSVELKGHFYTKIDFYQDRKYGKVPCPISVFRHVLFVPPYLRRWRGHQRLEEGLGRGRHAAAVQGGRGGGGGRGCGGRMG